jgi:hypothetical protein
VVCPAKVFGLGDFDVRACPDATNRYDPQLGYRADSRTGTPVCVHPHRLGVPPGEYRSAGTPLPAAPQQVPAPADALELPDELIDLEAWMIAVVRAAGPDRLAGALDAVETLARTRFAEHEVVTALRRILTVELARQPASRPPTASPRPRPAHQGGAAAAAPSGAGSRWTDLL